MKTMMKRILTIATMLATAMTMSAADYGYLVVEQLDGTKTALPTSGLTLVFADGTLTANALGETTTFTQALLSKMYFSDDNMSGIGDMADGQQTTIRVNDRMVQVAAPEGAHVVIANVGGMLIDRYTATGEPVNTPLRKGIFIIKVNDKSTKIHVK